MRIGFTYDLYDESLVKKDDVADKYYEWDDLELIDKIKKAIEESGHVIVDIGNFDNLLKSIEILDTKVDMVFNLCEGLSGRNRESEVPLLLEKFSIPFVGADALSMGITLDKVVTKKMLLSEDIPTPKFITTRLVIKQQIENFSLSFPLIIKLRWEGSSKGLTEKSIVNNLTDLNEQIDYLVKTYDQPVIIEEFISGREFSVPIIGNGNEAEALSVNEIYFSGNKLGRKIYLSNQVCDFEDVRYSANPDLKTEKIEDIKNIALRVFSCVEARDFSRVDIRMDKSGKVYVLEINSLPSMSDIDHFGEMRRFKKWSYAKVFEKIIDAAAKRYGL